jgi:serine/threonine protein kinase
MNQSLHTHGFLHIELQDSLRNICDVIPQASEISRLGKPQDIYGDTWRFLDRSLSTTPDGRPIYVGWQIGDLYREGTYGKIFRASRMTVVRCNDTDFEVLEPPHEVIVKQTPPPEGSTILPKEDVLAHTSEALLHILAWRSIQRTQTPWAIPLPYEVFGDYDPVSKGWLSMSFCMSYVNGRTLHSYMKKHWNPNKKRENSRALIEILAQVAYILYSLQHTLRLNHRDVKVNNILIRARKEPMLLELGGKQILTHFEITLIDFGFACVGCPPPQQPLTAFQASSWFPFGELCCKKGRDLMQLIFCIHCYFPLNRYLLPELYRLFYDWMQIPWEGGIANALHGFTKEGRPRRTGLTSPPEYDTGIYEFLRRSEVDPAQWEPRYIFRECARLHLYF